MSEFLDALMLFVGVIAPLFWVFSIGHIIELEGADSDSFFLVLLAPAAGMVIAAALYGILRWVGVL